MQKGFTFVELMIIVSISLLLTFMVVFSYAKFHQRSQDYVCRGNIKMLYYAMMQYGLDHGLKVGDTVVFSDLNPEYYKDDLPCCSDGTTAFSETLTYGVVPVCPRGEHVWSPDEDVGL